MPQIEVQGQVHTFGARCATFIMHLRDFINSRDCVLFVGHRFALLCNVQSFIYLSSQCPIFLLFSTGWSRFNCHTDYRILSTMC